MRRTHRGIGLGAFIGLCLLGIGCEGEITLDDAGAPDAGTVEIDAGGTDETPPRVTSSRPRSGEDLVSRAHELEIRFDEAVVLARGRITAEGPSGEIALGERSAVPEGDVVRVGALEGWPGGARIEVEVALFEDGAGNVQEDTFTFVFETDDDGAPEVILTSPVEGAVEVPSESVIIAVTFSEPMNPRLGTFTLDGQGSTSSAAWSSDREVRVELTRLRAGTAYALRLEGFEDRSANPFEPTATLGDGAIDFTTRADTTAPTVIDSAPTDGQLDVDVGRLTSVEVTFDEPMDRTVRNATFVAGSAVGTLIGNWNPEGTRVQFAVGGRFLVDADHRIDLRDFRDEAGNALATDVGLTDGTLTFRTSAADSEIPFVVFSAPSEGSIDVDTHLAALRVIFSEEMDVARTEITLETAGTSVTRAGTWNVARTELTVPLSGLAPMEVHRVELGAFEDASGNALDTTHAYLVDGALDFTSGQASGESCADPLGIAEAIVDGAAYEWALVGGQFDAPDGAPSCSTLSSVDAGVIVYEKTSASLSAGGAALFITATSPDALNGVQLEVRREVCDPAAVGGGLAAREICLTQRPRWEQYVDVPAGTYYLWVANEAAAFEGATIRIEEVPAIPEGQSCGDPFTTSSTIHTVLGPDAHRWVVPGASTQSSNFGSSTDGEGAMECALQQGPDVVIEVPKARAGSILDVRVDPFPADTGPGIFDHAGTNVAALDACDSEVATLLACPGRIRTPEHFQLTGAAGDYYVWLAANNSEVELVRTTVEVREIDPQLGETCATAIPLVAGTSNPVTPASGGSFFVPSCLEADTGVTWYRYTTTEDLNVVTLSGGVAPLALIDANAAREVACVDDGSLGGIPRRAPAGSEVCVAVPSDPAITGISIAELPWQGVDGVVSDLGIGRPLDGAGAARAITTDAWLEVTPTQLYMGINVTSSTTAGLVTAPRSGGTVADFLPVSVFQIGNAGLGFGEALFSIDETSEAARPQRLFRLIDPTGAIGATAWDTGSVYDAALDIDTIARIAGTNDFVMVSDDATAPVVATTFYRGSSSTPGPVTVLGQNAALTAVVALAANDAFVFVAASGADGRTVYRVPLANVGATPEALAPADLVGFSTANGAFAYDGTRDVLYFRSTRSPAGVHALFAASSVAPIYAGAVVTIGTSSDFGMAFDPAVPALFLFETSTVSTGNFVEVR